MLDNKKFFTQTEASKAFFQKLSKIDVNDSTLHTLAGVDVDELIEDREQLKDCIKSILNTQEMLARTDFAELKKEAEELFKINLLSRIASQYIDAYLADVSAQKKRLKDAQSNSINPWTKIDKLFKDIGLEKEGDLHLIVKEKIIKVMQTIGEAKLQDLKKNPDSLKNVSLLEQIGHYINKVIRAVTFGLAGYEFSDKEAKEALDHDFQVETNTRFGQVVKKLIPKKDVVAIDDINQNDKDQTYVEYNQSQQQNNNGPSIVSK